MTRIPAPFFSTDSRPLAAFFSALMIVLPALAPRSSTAQDADSASATELNGPAEEPLPLAERYGLGGFSGFGDKVRINSLQTTYDSNTGVATAVGNVDIQYEDVQLYAGRAEYHRDTGDIFAKENVRIYQGDRIYRGENVVYNTQTGKIIATNLRSKVGPVFYDSKSIDLNAQDTDLITLEDATLTSHDSEFFNYHIKAKTIEIYPDDRFVMEDIDFYLGDTKIFSLPYLAQPFDNEFGFRVTPGSSSRWGVFALGEYTTLVDDHSLVTLHLDGRSRRGIAGGIDIESVRHKEYDAFGHLTLYYANDTGSDINVTGEPRDSINEDRYRIGLQHRIYVPGPEESTLYIDINVTKFSDSDVLEDFFPPDYRLDPRPDNMVNIVKQTEGGEFSLLTRFRANDFFTNDTRTPELALEFTRQPILDTGLFYEGFTTAGIYDEEYDKDGRATYAAVAASLANQPGTMREIATLATLGDGNQFTRLNTYHQLVYPIEITDGFNLVPRAGVGTTLYQDAGGGAVNGDEERPYLHLGIEGSIKYSKLYPDLQNRAFGINEMRHIFEPYFNYSYVTADDLPAGFPLIDRYAPTTRLRSLDIGQYPAVDEIRDWSTLRIGAHNRFQTRRDGEMRRIGLDEPVESHGGDQGYTHNFLEVNSFFEVYFTDPEYDRDFSNFFNEVIWWPLPWLEFRFDSQTPVFGEPVDFSEYNTSFSFMPWSNTEFTLGHRYLSNHPYLADGSQITFDSYTRISDNWGFRMGHRFEIDDSTLEMQQYSIHRDLSSWTLGIGGIVLDNRVDEEYGFLFTLTLKDFPTKTLPFSVFTAGY